jgi:hypothetical protein
MSEGEVEGGGEAGRALVRETLIKPLQASGLRRGKGQTEKALADSLEHLVGQLDHMTADNLHTLADVVLDKAAAPGPQQGVWPAEVLIRAWGHGLQPRQFRLHRIVTSWLASVEGPVAEAGGWLVPLFRFLRQHHRPPTPYDLTAIREQARADNRTLALIDDRIERGVVGEQDRAWRAAWLADQREARGYVERGRTGRNGADMGGQAA